jgi:hypothetical protein
MKIWNFAQFFVGMKLGLRRKKKSFNSSSEKEISEVFSLIS